MAIDFARVITVIDKVIYKVIYKVIHENKVKLMSEVNYSYTHKKLIWSSNYLKRFDTYYHLAPVMLNMSVQNSF